MLYVSRAVDRTDDYGVVDTDDGVEEVYNKDYLLSVGTSLKIRGVDTNTGSIEPYSEKFIEKQIRKFKVAGVFPINAKYKITETISGSLIALSGIKIGLNILSASGDVKKLRIPEGVVWFNTDFDFALELNNLKEVVLPCSIKVLCDGCFAHCTKLHKINIPKNLKVLENHCFMNTGFEHLDLSKSHIEKIYSNCFGECEKLKSIVLPKTLNYDNNHSGAVVSFDSCPNLEEVVYNSRIKELPDYAFVDCNRLRVLYLPYGLEVISSQMLVKLKSLTDVYCRGNTDIADMLLSEIGSLGAGDRIRIHI